jgi:hypothetical protein
MGLRRSDPGSFSGNLVLESANGYAITSCLHWGYIQSYARGSIIHYSKLISYPINSGSSTFRKLVQFSHSSSTRKSRPSLLAVCNREPRASGKVKHSGRGRWFSGSGSRSSAHRSICILVLQTQKPQREDASCNLIHGVRPLSQTPTPQELTHFIEDLEVDPLHHYKAVASIPSLSNLFVPTAQRTGSLP